MLRRRAGSGSTAARVCRRHMTLQAHSGVVWWRCPDALSDHQGTLALGLDISTRATGYCVLDAEDGRILEWGCIETPTPLDRYERATTMAEELQAIHLRHSTTKGTKWLVGAEDYAKRWSGGRGNLFSLAEANVATTLICHQVFGSTPTAVHPHTARSQVGVPTAAAATRRTAARRNADSDRIGHGAVTEQHSPLSVKDRVLEFVSSRVPVGFEWPLQAAAKAAAAKNKASDSTEAATCAAMLHSCCYDVADAYIIACYIVLHTENCRLLAHNADLLMDRQAAYRASKRYISNLEKARKERGKAAARQYDASVSKRIEQKLLADLRAGTA